MYVDNQEKTITHKAIGTVETHQASQSARIDRQTGVIGVEILASAANNAEVYTSGNLSKGGNRPTAAYIISGSTALFKVAITEGFALQVKINSNATLTVGTFPLSVRVQFGNTQSEDIRLSVEATA